MLVNYARYCMWVWRGLTLIHQDKPDFLIRADYRGGQIGEGRILIQFSRIHLLLNSDGVTMETSGCTN
jgi:hypothetical protein